MSLENEILCRIKPDEGTCLSILDKASKLKELTEYYLNARNIPAKVRFVGSVAKGTFLANPDIDMFIMFPESYPRDEMEKIGIQAGRDLINGKLMYAEHPYSSGVYEGIEVDMVPCYFHKTTENLMTSVDRTPFHTDYILNHTNEKLRDEMRLMKKFMKGIGTYGAEPDIRGFSGYLCEVITLYHKGFLETIKAASEWKVGTTLVPEEKGPTFKEPLVVYDPVDCKRNVASAVHEDTLCKFITACKAYLENPSEKFFFPSKRTPMSEEECDGYLKKGDMHIVSLTFDRPDVIIENLHAQVWRTENGIRKKLSEFGFDSLRAVHETYSDYVTIVLLMSNISLSKTMRHPGPPVGKGNVTKFMEKWENNPYGKPFIEDGKWNVIRDRHYTDIRALLQNEIESIGMGKMIDAGTLCVRVDNEVLEHTEPLLISELLNPMFPWEF